MGTTIFQLDLSTVQNWPEIAAEVHYRAPLLAKYWKINLRCLQRQFRKQLHTTPQKHLNMVRLKEAQRLARQKMRTKEICNQLEFKQVSHLCRQVHAHFGATLGSLRNSFSDFAPNDRGR